MKSLSNQQVSSAVLPLILAVTVVITVAAIIILGNIAKDNQTYDRYNACVLSVPALERNQAKIDKCYHQVQDDTGRSIKRYDQ